MFLFNIIHPYRTSNLPYSRLPPPPENGSDYYQCTLHKAEVPKSDIYVILKVNRIGLLADKWQENEVSSDKINKWGQISSLVWLNLLFIQTIAYKTQKLSRQFFVTTFIVTWKSSHFIYQQHKHRMKYVKRSRIHNYSVLM